MEGGVKMGVVGCRRSEYVVPDVSAAKADDLFDAARIAFMRAEVETVPFKGTHREWAEIAVRAAVAPYEARLADLERDRDAAFAVLRDAGVKGDYPTLADACRQLAQIAVGADLI